MNLYDFIEDSIVDGIGLRTVIAIQGCSHNCIECHNPNSHDYNKGIPFTEELQNEILAKIEKNILLDGITLSGGDPFFSAKQVLSFVKKIKQNIPNLNIWIYSGFTFEEIIKSNNDSKKELLFLCDVIVDGKFILEERNIILPFKGSNNQRIIKIKESTIDKIVQF